MARTISMSKSYWTINLPYTDEFGRHNNKLRRTFYDKLSAHPLYLKTNRARVSKAEAERVCAEISRDVGFPLEVNETSDLCF